MSLVNYAPIYNKDGVNVNTDGNTTYRTIRCLSCNKQWESKTHRGSTTYKEKS